MVDVSTRGWCKTGKWRYINIPVPLILWVIKLKPLHGSLNYPFWGDQTMHIYGDFDGFPPQKKCLVWGGVISSPVRVSSIFHCSNWSTHILRMISIHKGFYILKVGWVYPHYTDPMGFKTQDIHCSNWSFCATPSVAKKSKASLISWWSL